MTKPASLLNVLAAVIFILSFSECNMDNYEPVLFSIRITEDVTFGQKNNMVFSFACNGSIIPDVEINGYHIEQFSTTSSIISAHVKMPYSDTIQFSITANGHTTNGFLLTPPRITRLYCNDQAIYSTSDIYSSENYHFVWETVKCDHQFIGITSAVPEMNIVLESNVNEYTFSADELQSISTVYLSTVNGDRLVPGGEPGFAGDYGQGFCSVETTARYTLSIKNIYNKSSKLTNLFDKEHFHQQHLRDFFQFLGNNK